MFLIFLMNVFLIPFFSHLTHYLWLENFIYIYIYIYLCMYVYIHILINILIHIDIKLISICRYFHLAYNFY